MITLAVFLLGLVLTYFLQETTRQTARQLRQAEFDFRVDEITQNIHRRLQNYELVLNGAAGLFRASHEVGRKEFSEYVDTLKLAGNYPGIQGVGFSQVVRPQDKPGHLARIRGEGFPDYDIRPAGRRELYTSIVYLEPFDWRNQRAFGYDMYSEPVRRAAMARARDEDKTIISGKVRLVQETEQDTQVGFLMYLPVYRPGSAHLTLTERRANLIGWVYAPFRMDELDLEHAGDGRHARKVAFQIWQDGELSLHSPSAPNEPLAEQKEGFSEREIDGRRWRVYSTRDAGRHIQIHVGERLDIRDKLAVELAENLLRPLLFGLPVLAVLIWLAVRQGLRPLDALAAEVAARAPGNLAPIEIGQNPAETRPLIERLNTLFARLGRSLEQERRFTADAAHELRTPLAGIRAQAQVALGAGDEASRSHALHAAIAGCDRATHLVEQLLTLARIDAAGSAPSETISLRALAQDVLADLAPQALEKGIALELVDGEDCEVAGHGTWLRILLRNLLDNALRYSRTGDAVRVEIGREHGRPALWVIDTGPGIPEAERAQVRERFYRVLGTGERGSGLGLSIVQRIAEVHGGELRLLPGDDGRGLKAGVVFAA
jgi:two-component system sensor histidine kinase QseC